MIDYERAKDTFAGLVIAVWILFVGLLVIRILLSVDWLPWVIGIMIVAGLTTWACNRIWPGGRWR